MRRLSFVLFTAVFVMLTGVVFTGRAEAAPYSQVVDNSTPGRFSASGGWGVSSWNSQKFGTNYRYTIPKPVADSAWFKVKIPTTGNYAVYAWWPSNPGYNSSTPVGIQTTSGMKWVRVDQRKNGGKWVYLGTYNMAAGDGWKILFSRWTTTKGYIAADSVRVVQASATAPAQGMGKNIVAEAQTWLGVPYSYGGASRSGVDCSGLTMQVFSKFGINLPRVAADQYRYGRAVSTPAAGDLVFGNFSGGSSVTHVGIATGDGRMINAPYPGTVVRYDPIYQKYTIGYKRLVP